MDEAEKVLLDSGFDNQKCGASLALAAFDLFLAKKDPRCEGWAERVTTLMEIKAPTRVFAYAVDLSVQNGAFLEGLAVAEAVLTNFYQNAGKSLDKVELEQIKALKDMNVETEDWKMVFGMFANIFRFTEHAAQSCELYEALVKAEPMNREYQTNYLQMRHWLSAMDKSSTELKELYLQAATAAFELFPTSRSIADVKLQALMMNRRWSEMIEVANNFTSSHCKVQSRGLQMWTVLASLHLEGRKAKFLKEYKSKPLTWWKGRAGFAIYEQLAHLHIALRLDDYETLSKSMERIIMQPIDEVGVEAIFAFSRSFLESNPVMSTIGPLVAAQLPLREFIPFHSHIWRYSITFFCNNQMFDKALMLLQDIQTRWKLGKEDEIRLVQCLIEMNETEDVMEILTNMEANKDFDKFKLDISILKLRAMLRTGHYKAAMKLHDQMVAWRSEYVFEGSLKWRMNEFLQTFGILPSSVKFHMLTFLNTFVIAFSSFAVLLLPFKYSGEPFLGYEQWHRMDSEYGIFLSGQWSKLCSTTSEYPQYIDLAHGVAVMNTVKEEAPEAAHIAMYRSLVASLKALDRDDEAARVERWFAKRSKQS